MSDKEPHRTDVYVVQQGQNCPASLKFCLENPNGVWLRYVPSKKSHLTNIDLDTTA